MQDCEQRIDVLEHEHSEQSLLLQSVDFPASQKETQPAGEIQRVQTVENEPVIESSSNKPNKIVISENVSQRQKKIE